MIGDLGQKRCPVCQSVVHILIQQCPDCGHWFRTQFVHGPSNRTTFIPPNGGGQQPPNNPHPPNYGYSYHHPHGQFVQKPPGSHSATVAALLGIFCILGAPQLYNGQCLKALTLFVSALVVLTLTGCLAYPIFFIIGLVDGINIANKLNTGRPVGTWEFF